MSDSLPKATQPPAPSSVPEVAFVLELGRALQTFGVSAPTLESALGRVASHLGLDGAIYATPTGFLASLRMEGHHSKTYLQRIEIGESNLERLADLEGLVDQVLDGHLDVSGARTRLAELLERPCRLSPVLAVAAYAAASLGTARVFGGGLAEVLFAGLTGLMVGLAVQLVPRRPVIQRLMPLVGGLVAALASAVVVFFLPSVSQGVLILSGIIVLVPGLGLLVSMQELGTGNLVSGTARLAGTGLVFLLLAFGVGLGQRLSGGLVQTSSLTSAALPPWTVIPALALSVLGFMAVFQAPMRDLGWILLVSALGVGASRLGTTLLGPEAGAGLGAFLLGAACNFHARRSRRPAMVFLLPSLMLILPGSLGFRGLTLLLQQQTVSGLEVGFRAIFVSVALMLGLFVANATVPRRRF